MACDISRAKRSACVLRVERCSGQKIQPNRAVLPDSYCATSGIVPRCAKIVTRNDVSAPPLTTDRSGWVEQKPISITSSCTNRWFVRIQRIALKSNKPSSNEPNKRNSTGSERARLKLDRVLGLQNNFLYYLLILCRLDDIFWMPGL